MGTDIKNPWVGRLSLAIVICAALLCTSWFRYKLSSLTETSSLQIKEVMLVPPGRVIRMADLGYHTLAADLLFIRANLYYGQHMYTDEQLPWLADFIDILLEVDPYFKKSYLWGAMATTYYKRQVDFVPQELIQRANSILEKGMLIFPDDHMFPMRIAFNLYYESGQTKQSIPYFERASRIPGAPAWLKSKAADLYTKEGDKNIAQRMVTDILAETEDENLSRTLQARIDLLLDPKERKSMLNLRQSMFDGWRECCAYLPYDMYLLLRQQ